MSGKHKFLNVTAFLRLADETWKSGTRRPPLEIWRRNQRLQDGSTRDHPVRAPTPRTRRSRLGKGEVLLPTRINPPRNSMSFPQFSLVRTYCSSSRDGGSGEPPENKTGQEEECRKGKGIKFPKRSRPRKSRLGKLEPFMEESLDLDLEKKPKKRFSHSHPRISIELTTSSGHIIKASNEPGKDKDGRIKELKTGVAKPIGSQDKIVMEDDSSRNSPTGTKFNPPETSSTQKPPSKTPGGGNAPTKPPTKPPGDPPPAAAKPAGTEPPGFKPPPSAAKPAGTPPSKPPPSGAKPAGTPPPAGAKPAAPSPPGSKPPPTGAKPAGPSPPGSKPPTTDAKPAGTPPPTGAKPAGTPPSGKPPPTEAKPAGTPPPTGAKPAGPSPSGGKPPPAGAKPPGPSPPGSSPPPTGSKPAGTGGSLPGTGGAAGADGGTRVITLMPGDGIGPEISMAVLQVLEAAKVPLLFEPVDVTPVMNSKGQTTIPQEVIDSMNRTKVGLKGPLMTPVGTGFRSLNLTLRQMFNLYANIRPCRSLPGVETVYGDVDIVTIRENTEGEYSGIEHTLVQGVVQSIKLITRQASLRVAEYCFQYAIAMKRKKVTAVGEESAMRMSDGLFLRCVREMAAKYKSQLDAAGVVYEESTMTTVCLKIVEDPRKYDVLVLPNLYGDIISDTCAGLIGGLGLTPSGNIGTEGAIFESVHGTAPDIAGKDLANPTALLLSTIMMLHYVGMPEQAANIEQAILKTIQEDNIRTVDLGGKAKCSEYTQALIKNLK
ncbi:hypothetical protein KR009_002407 [Drosophila setifemur]|nr:hypothetical protein KR009_002407 [Drosophila setifemur]